MSNFILLVISALLGVGGQILLKKASSICSLDNGVVQYFLSLLCNIYAWGGAFSYGLSLALYMVALNRVQLSIARSINTVSYVLLIILSMIIFKESISFLQIVGMILITIGIFILGFSVR